MNIENHVVYDLVDCMQAKCRLKQAIIKDSSLDYLYTLPSGKNFPTNVVCSFTSIVEKLASIFDFVLVDSPAGLDDGFKRAVNSCTEAIVVTTPHISAIRDASKTLTTLYGTEHIVSSNIIINRIRGDMVAGGEMMSHADIQKLLNEKCLGVVPEDDDYNASSTIRFLGESQKLINKSFIVLANNLMNGEEKLIDYTSKYKGIWGYVRRKLKKI